MPWPKAVRDDLWGNIQPQPSWGVTVKDVDATAWPAMPALYQPAPVDAVVQRYATDVRAYFRKGLTNPRIVAGLGQLETALRAGLAVAEVASGAALLPPGALANHDHYYAALDPIRRRTPGVHDLTHHLVRETLVAGLRAAGWWATPTVPPTDPIAVPMGLLGAKDFYGLLVLNRHLKDVTIGQEHGEWTHLLQWYLLATNPPGTGFNSWMLYEALGRQGWQQGATSVAEHFEAPPTLWQVLFDRVAPYYHVQNWLADDGNDFSCPDMLHVSLAGLASNRESTVRGHAAPAVMNVLDGNFYINGKLHNTRTDWPLLTALLGRRVEKRVPLYRESQKADDVMDAEVARLSNKLAALHHSDGSQIIDVVKSNIQKIVEQRDQPFEPHLSWDDAKLTPADKLDIQKIIQSHRNMTDHMKHLLLGQFRTRALLYLGAKQSPKALQGPGVWWKTLSPIERAELLTKSGRVSA